jgi:hypothetical protein
MCASGREAILILSLSERSRGTGRARILNQNGDNTRVVELMNANTGQIPRSVPEATYAPARPTNMPDLLQDPLP